MVPMADEKTNIPTPQKRSLFRKIVNVFIGLLVVILVLIVLIFGFTQTKTFRSILKNKVVEIANNELNGRVNIGEIDGTIFTSLILRDVLVTQQQDTILASQKIEVKTSPLQLLLSKIFIRSIELDNTKINLVKDTAGVYNISTLFKPSVDEDTVKSKFGYKIIVADLKINNASIRNTSLENKNSYRSYTTINSDDIHIDSLFLRLNAYADIKNNYFNLEINKFNFKPNLTNFRLYDMSGKFELTDNHAVISDFNFNSNTSDFDIDAKLEDFNLFDDFGLAKLKNSPVSVNLDARVFDFTDLTSYISSTDIMKGTVKMKLDIDGTFGNINIKEVSLDYLKTHLNFHGKVLNLHTPEKLFFDAHFYDSFINEPDIDKLLPVYKLPVYDNLYLKNLRLEFLGEPLNFTANFNTDLPEGYIEAKTKFDFTAEKMKYDVSLITSRLNLNPVLNTPTSLNLTADIKGEGTSPQEMNSNVTLGLKNSVYNQFRIDTLKLTTRAQDGNIRMLMNTLANDTRIYLNGNLDYTDPDNPEYELAGRFNELDLNKLISDSTLKSNLNLSFDLEGESFEPDNIVADLNLLIHPSEFKGRKIDSTALSLAYHKNGDRRRSINFRSDFVDFDITGEYNLLRAIQLISYQADVITKTVMKKIYDFNPMALVSDSVKVGELGKRFEIQVEPPPVIQDKLNMFYKMDIKDFALVSMFTGFDQMDVDGNISGQIENSYGNFTSSIAVNLDKLRLLAGGNVTYASNMDLRLKIGRSNNSISFENINLDARLTTDRVFSGTDLKSIKLVLGLKNSVFSYNAAMEMDTTAKAEIAGLTDMSGNQFRFRIDKLWADYMNFVWQNEGALAGTYTKDSFIIDNFTLFRNGTRIKLNGSLYSDGKENLKLTVENLSTDIISFFAGMDPNSIKGTINLNMMLNGYLHEPVIDLTLDMDSLSAQNVNLGFLRSKIHYDNHLLVADVKFLDSTFNMERPALALDGNIPIDLSFVGAEERLIPGKPIEMNLRSNDFYLSTFAPFVPVVKNLNGRLISDLKISGTTDNINYAGNIRIEEGSFLSSFNNMPYEMDLVISLAQELITIESLNIRNSRRSDYRGVLSGNGNIKFDALKPVSANMILNGDLKVLSNATQAVMPIFYGDLVVRSDGNWRFTYENGKANLDGVLLLANTNVTYNAVYQTAYSGEDDFIYRFIPDTTRPDRKQEEFNQIVSLSRKYSPIQPPKEESSFDLDYNLRVRILDEARVRVILNQEANQGLSLVMDGQLALGKGGVAQGEFNLKEGSELQFIKTLSAEGSVVFESELTNPRLNITAVYAQEYIPPDQEDESLTEPELVEVRIKLSGSLENLSENLARAEDNIAVYEGEENIEEDIASPQRGSADAISFIIFGVFTEDLAAGNFTGGSSGQSDFLGGYGTSLLGGLLSGFANSQLGDVVRNIELERTDNNDTRVNVSGRYQNIRYTIGSSTENYSKFGQANIKIEYPVNDRFIVRFEQREPHSSTTTNIQQRIQEIALRYRFIF